VEIEELNGLPSLLPSRGVTNLSDSSIGLRSEDVSLSSIRVIEQDRAISVVGNHLLPRVSPSRVNLEEGESVRVCSEHASFTSLGIVHKNEAIGSNNLLPGSSPSVLLVSEVQFPVGTNGEETSALTLFVVHQETSLSSNRNRDNLVPGFSPSTESSFLNESIVFDSEDEGFSSVLIVEQSSVGSVWVGNRDDHLPGLSPAEVLFSIHIVVIHGCNVTRSCVPVVEDCLVSNVHNLRPGALPTLMMPVVSKVEATLHIEERSTVSWFVKEKARHY